MNLHLVPQPERLANNHLTPAHLTEDQFGELLTRSSQPADSAASTADAHLLACAQCAAELAALRDSLALFRDAASAYADKELRSLPRIATPQRRIFPAALQPVWWLAAASLLLAAGLPLQLARQHAKHAAVVAATVTDSSAQSNSDEALLEAIDRDTSASVPASMQALADPTATASSTAISTSSQTSTQRKD